MKIKYMIEWLFHYAVTKRQISFSDEDEVKTENRIANIEKYVGRRIIKGQEAQDYLYDLVKGNKPFSLGRNGQREVVFFEKIIFDKLFKTDRHTKEPMMQLCLSGEEEYQTYCKIIEEAYWGMDINCVWKTVSMEEWIYKYNSPNSVLIDASSVNLYSFWDNESCWLRALEGKKVLVVSIFAEQMLEQYRTKRTKLHQNPSLLPEFELCAVKSIWWYGENKDTRFQSWDEALNYLENECMKCDFDIALLSCSHFSMPLAERLKRHKKQAIQVGGALQLLFGIKGKRWNHIFEGKYYNEFWVVPDANTKISSASLLDDVAGGPYWY